MSKASLFVDCQILQTKAFDRGMGKYISSLLIALSSNADFNKTYSRTIIILNKNLDTSLERLKFIGALIPNSETVLLDLSVDIDKGDLATKETVSQKVLSDYIEKQQKNTTEVSHFLITAPFFIGFTSVFPSQSDIVKLCIVYDFIPYRIWHKQKIFPDNLYFRHFSLFLEADFLFTISQFVCDDLTQLFGLNSSKVRTIDGGPFGSADKPTGRTVRLIKEKYILYPSAPIVHKNNEMAVKGFAVFNKRHGNSFKLVFTSSFNEETKTKLQNISKDIIFTDNISDMALADVYRESEAVLFASLSEGLGMPVLEAMLYDKPVACSEIPVLSEISSKALIFFSPNSAASIADALDKSINQKIFAMHRQEYEKVLKKYSWAQSAVKLTAVTKKFLKVPQRIERPTLAVVTTDPEVDSKSSRIIERMYFRLSENYKLRLYEQKPTRRWRTTKHAPSFSKHLASTEEMPSAVLALGVGKVPQELLQLPTISSGVANKLSRTKNRSKLFFKPKRVSIDAYLDFHDWEYEQKNEVTESIVKELSKVIKDIK